MVCSKCEKKLTKLAAPDPTALTSSKEGKREIGVNLLLKGPGSSASTSARGKRFQPYEARKCLGCKANLSQANGGKAKYCHGCAFKKGICAMCAKSIVDTSMFTMSTK